MMNMKKISMLAALCMVIAPSYMHAELDLNIHNGQFYSKNPKYIVDQDMYHNYIQAVSDMIENGGIDDGDAPKMQAAIEIFLKKYNNSTANQLIEDYKEILKDEASMDAFAEKIMTRISELMELQFAIMNNELAGYYY